MVCDQDLEFEDAVSEEPEGMDQESDSPAWPFQHHEELHEMWVRSIHSEMGVDHLYQQVHALQANQQAFVDGVYQEVTGCKSEVLRLSEDFSGLRNHLQTLDGHLQDQRRWVHETLGEFGRSTRVTNSSPVVPPTKPMLSEDDFNG